MENFLLKGEELISQSANNVVILTTHRIRYNATNSAQSHLVSMMLEKVSSCESRYQSWPVLLVLGVLAVLLGGFSLFQFGGQQMAAPAIAVGFVLVVAYFASRKHVISISSDGGSRIGFETKGLKREAVVSFINGIEKAKTERVERLHQLAASVLA